MRIFVSPRHEFRVVMAARVQINVLNGVPCPSRHRIRHAFSMGIQSMTFAAQHPHRAGVYSSRMNGQAQALARWITRLIAFIVLSVSGGALAQHWLERQQPAIQPQSCQGDGCGQTAEHVTIILPERRSDAGSNLLVTPTLESITPLPRPRLEFLLLPVVLVALMVVFLERTSSPRAPPVLA